MRITRLWATVAVAAVGLLATPGLATAAPDYPAPPPRISVDTVTVGAGGIVTVFATGFVPGERVSVDVTYGATGDIAHHGGLTVQPAALVAAPAALVAAPAAYLKTVNADGDGTVRTTLRLTRVGRATITLTGASGRTASITVRVISDRSGADDPDQGDASDDGLPRTGTDVGRIVVIGALSIALGGVLVWFTMMRRRRGTTPA